MTDVFVTDVASVLNRPSVNSETESFFPFHRRGIMIGHDDTSLPFFDHMWDMKGMARRSHVALQSCEKMLIGVHKVERAEFTKLRNLKNVGSKSKPRTRTIMNLSFFVDEVQNRIKCRNDLKSRSLFFCGKTKVLPTRFGPRPNS